MRNGIRSRPTLVVAGICGILLAGIVVVSLHFSGVAGAVSLQDANAEVTTGLNELQDQLPLSAVGDSSEESATEPCPDGSSGQLARVERTIVTVPGFDVPGWVRQLSAKYSTLEGWSAKLRAVGSNGHLVLTLVDQKLMLYTVTTGSSDHPEAFTIRATSRCSTI